MKYKLLRIYVWLFSKGYLKIFNDILLEATLRTKGYNNYLNNKDSGESFFIKKILAPTNPKVCIDIGANIGNYSKELLMKTNTDVIAFEPIPFVFSELKDNLKKFKNRVVFENFGIGSENKSLKINYNNEKTTHASFAKEAEKVDFVNNNLSKIVKVITLDSYIIKNKIKTLDFIKIDTEGFEPEVFKGALRSIKKLKPRFIQMEFNWHHLFRNTTLNYYAELLNGYDVYQLTCNGWIKRDPKHPLSNIFFFSNFVFVRQGTF